MDAIRSGTRPGGQRRASHTLALGFVASLACAWLAQPAEAIVYKWSDTLGRIHYSDLPPPPDGTLISIDMSYDHNYRPVAAHSAARPAQPLANAAGPPPGQTQQTQLKQAVDNDVATARSEDCKQSQERYQNYVRSRRLYKEGPNKERVYLTDAELGTERVNAKREADEACAANPAR